MKGRNIKLVGAAILASLFLPIAANGSVISFSDSVFLNTNWTVVEIRDTTPNDSFVFSATQLGGGGNPGAYREVVNTLNTPTASSIASGHLFQGGIFDPGEDGTFLSLAMSLDGIGQPGGPAGAMAYGLLLEQGGNYFTFGPGQVLNGAGWMNFSQSGLVESDFVAEGADTLDLSNSGSPVNVGFFVSNGTFGNPSTNTGGVDNWSFQITTTVIPIPAAAWLFISALGGLVVAKRKQLKA